MTTITEGRHPGCFILSEAQGHRSRDTVTIAEGENVIAGEVLGLVGANEGTVTVGDPAFTGTGNGTLTKATPAYGTGVQEGTYRIALVEITTDNGRFQVVRPDGTTDGFARVGVAYDGQVKFTIADGSTDFSAGAQFTLAVTIAAADDEGEYKALDLSATDGAETAYAVSFGNYDATAAAVEGVAVNRDAELIADDLTWPSGITSDQKNAAIAQLATRGLIVRT